MWEPLLDFLWLSPPNATVRLVNHTFGDHRIGELVLPKHHRVERQATITREEANHTLRENVTEGDRLHFLGSIPINILEANSSFVTYRFDIDQEMTFDVERSQGLQVVAALAPDGRSIVFTLNVPKGGFTAHNNCELLRKVIESGYYHVREANDEYLVLDRYNTRTEYAVQNQKVSLEVTFVDNEPVDISSRNHAH